MRKLRLESLEDRTLLAVTAGLNPAAAALPQETGASLVVTTLNDTVDSTDGVTSLREAIAAASEGDTVTFDESLAGGTITLAGSQIEITAGITIDAADIGGITISGNGTSSIFSVTGGSENTPVSLSGLTMTDGYAEFNGGAINAGYGCVLTLAGCTLNNNSAGGNGGAVYSMGNVTLTDCTLSANMASSGGGAINNAFGSVLTMIGCSVSANSASGNGGAIYNAGSSATLTDCVFSDNTAGTLGNGGAIVNNYNKTMSITGCLVYGNSAGQNGAGVYNYGNLTLLSSTITGNTASNMGGGLYDYGTTSVYNTIIAENSAGKGTDIFSSSSGARYGYNVISSYSGWTASEDCITYDSSEILFADAENHDYSLAEGSQAVDVGNNGYVASDTDLAGNTRIVNSIVDIGAYEYQTESGGGEEESSSLIVTTLEDVIDSTDGVTSLREAIAAASEGETVTFDESLAGGTITLAGSQLEITAGITVDAAGIGGMTVDAGGESRVFLLSGGTSDHPVALIGLTITGGGNIASNNTANGAGIYATDVTVLTNCTFTGNNASGNTGAGGAIANVSGTMTIVDSFITDNTATGSWMAYGGGIYTTGGTLTITGSLIAGNTSNGSLYSYAGAIYNESTTLSVTNTTVAGNTASATWGSFGGAIWNNSEAAFYNCIVAANTAATSSDIYLVSDTGEVYAYNTLSSYEDWTESSDSIVYDSSESLFNDDYTLVSGSQAIDVGNNSYVVSDTDLGGDTRIVNGTVDLGAYEYQGGETEQLAVPVITTGSSGVYVSYGANRHIIAWEAVDDADSYELAYSSNGGETWTTVGTEETSAVVTGLTYGADMTYRVRALGNGDYSDSEWSDTATFNVCPMDVNNDGDISGGDRAILGSCWLSEEGDDDFLYAADINGDGDVSNGDRAYLVANWLLSVEDDADSLIYPAEKAADIIFAEFGSADLEIELNVF